MEAIFGDLYKQLVDAHNEVIGSLPLPSYEDLTEGPGVLSGLKAFSDAINWSEPFFKYLGGFHAAFWLFCFVWSRNNSNRTAICLCAAILAGLAMPYLNDFGSQHHEQLFVLEKGMNYFDANGTFMAALFGAPMILLSVLLQVKLLYYVAVMMVKVKRAQISQSAKAKAKSGGAFAEKETAKTK